MDYRIARRGRRRSAAFLGFVVVAFAVSAVSPSFASAAPTATITGGPAEGSSINAQGVTFTISAAINPANEIDFDCSLDSRPFAPCASGSAPTCVPAGLVPAFCTSNETFSYLTERNHVFRAVASECLASCEQDANWTEGPIATRTFNVDRRRPVVAVTSGPTLSYPLLRGVASFALFVNEPAQLNCSEATGAFAPCTSPFRFPRLANGLHYLRVDATDRAGNVSATVTHPFDVDIFKPKKCRKGKSAKAKTKRRKCVKQNAKAKAKWKKKHGLH